MKNGAVITIPEGVASTHGNTATVQPGLPGRWVIWSKSDHSPGAHFATPSGEEAAASGVKYATVRIKGGSVDRLLACDPASAMPQTYNKQLTR